jgi:hypothetical protein
MLFAQSPPCDRKARGAGNASGGTNMGVHRLVWGPAILPPSPRAWPVILGAVDGPIGCALIFFWESFRARRTREPGTHNHARERNLTKEQPRGGSMTPRREERLAARVFWIATTGPIGCTPICFLGVIPGRAEGASLESIATRNAEPAPAVIMDSGLAGYARAPEMTIRVVEETTRSAGVRADAPCGRRTRPDWRRPKPPRAGTAWQ